MQQGNNQNRAVLLSKRLCFVLRHAPGKYVSFESKVHRGGWLLVDDVLSHLHGVTRDELNEIVQNSKNAQNRPRFQLTLVDNKEFIRATYGHTFDLTIGPAIESNKNLSNQGNDPPEEKVPLLQTLVIDMMAQNIHDFGPYLDVIPVGLIVTQIFNQYKATCQKSKTIVSNKILRYFLTPHVEQLDLQGILVEESSLRAIGNTCKSLRSLCLRDCWTSVTDTSLQYIVKRCTQLKTLDLSGCKHLTNRGLQYIAQYCKNLEVLLVRWLPKITVAGIQAVAASCPHLVSVDFSGCHTTAIEDDECKNLGEMFPCVEFIKRSM